jgi:hypothetical protein
MTELQRQAYRHKEACMFFARDLVAVVVNIIYTMQALVAKSSQTGNDHSNYEFEITHVR